MSNTSTLQSRAWELVDFTGFDGLKLSEPKKIDAGKLGENDVLVKFKAASLNYRDLIIPKGMYPFRKSLFLPHIPFPFIDYLCPAVGCTLSSGSFPSSHKYFLKP